MHKIIINFVLLVVLGIMLFSLYRILSSRATEDQNISSLEGLYQQELQQNSQLETQKAYYSSSEYIEKVSRDDLNLAPAGEYIVVLPSITPTPVVVTPTKVTAPSSGSNLQEWFALFTQ
jgi:cell division protein FtsB